MQAVPPCKRCKLHCHVAATHQNYQFELALKVLVIGLTRTGTLELGFGEGLMLPDAGLDQVALNIVKKLWFEAQNHNPCIALRVLVVAALPTLEFQLAYVVLGHIFVQACYTP